MRLMAGLSIRFTLNFIIAVLAIMVLGLGVQRLSVSLARFGTAQHLAILSAVSGDLFAVQTNLWPERANIASALVGEAPVAAKLRDGVLQYRHELEAMYARSLAGLRGIALDGQQPIVAQLELAHQRVVDLRVDADVAMSVEKNARNAGLVAAWPAKTGEFLAALRATEDLVDAAIAVHDPVVDRLLTVKRQVWVTRNNAAIQALPAKLAIGARRAWSTQESIQVADAVGQESAAWEILRELVSQSGVPPSLLAAFTTTNVGYFGKDLPIRHGVYDALSAGRESGFTIESWLEHIQPGLDAISSVGTAAAGDMVEAAKAASSSAFGELLLCSGALLLAACLSVAGFVAVSLRISRPLLVLSRVMQRLAGQDFAMAVPNTQCGDELGAMARAAQAFAENGIAMQRLQRETAEQRRRNEAERREISVREEAARVQQEAVVEALAAGLAGLADGDLTYQMTDEVAPEYQRLRSDFNAAIVGLHDVVSDLSSRAGRLSAGSREIADASDALAARTEQQAARLQHSTAALQQITKAVARTAAGSQDSSRVAEAAERDAIRSEQVVRDAQAAMLAIAASADRIAAIIGVIDEIALQTNLLALNAAVEAARAGPDGRGFAVVASEVRALAQRSATSAKAIKTLISTSTRQVAAGVALVDETGAALDRILGQFSRIRRVMAEMADSAHEQATSLADVSAAVVEMDKMTQQNAAMVEQTTAATHSLSHETEQLGRASKRFRTG